MLIRRLSWALVCLSAIAASRTAWAEPQPILIEGTRIFPESLDSAPDGTIYVGSIGKGAVFKAAPGAAKATEFIAKQPNKLSAALGVVVDEPRQRLFVCSSDLNHIGEPVSLKVFDLGSGKLRLDLPFPESKGLCNDIAVAPDGTAYATDTPNARIFRLKPNASTLEVWASDPRLVGIDGIAFGPGGHLYVNNVRTGLLFRVEMKSDGGAGAVTQLQTSRPLDGPDGMRPAGPNRFVIAENKGGRVSLATLNGDSVQIKTLKEGFDFPPGVTVIGDYVWVIEGKAKFRSDPKFKDQDAGDFKITPVALPAAK